MVMEIIRYCLTSKQISRLVEILDQTGFRVSQQGHIEVKEIKPNHPAMGGTDRDPQNNPIQVNVPLPVGFVGDNYVSLANTDITFPEDYHRRLKTIFDLI